MFTCEITEKQITLDDYERGEELHSNWCDVDLDFENETLQGLMGDIAEFFGVSSDAIEALNGDGCITISRHENSDGELPTNGQITAFLSGDCKLWSTVYTGTIHQAVRVSKAELNEALNNIA